MKLSYIPKPIVLCILDGWGMAPPSPTNAITQVPSSNFQSMWAEYPHLLLPTSGINVGLPQGQAGDSEVGHLNLGAGRIVYQSVLRIDNAIADGSFFTNVAFQKAVDHAQKNSSQIHLMGLVGQGAVHSSTSHLYALLTFLQRNDVPKEKVKLHLFTDGRDSPPTSGKSQITQIQEKLVSENLGQIATVSGRYYAMDRDNRWDRTALAYFAITGKTKNRQPDPIRLVEDSYAKGKTDEFLIPAQITGTDGQPVGIISANDAVIFFNFRPDRARQLTRAFVSDSLESIKSASGDKVFTFDRGPKIPNLFFVTMTEYEKDLSVSAVAFPPEPVTLPLAQVLSERNLKQLHIAETEKYAHVTYFFNGGREESFPGEDRILISSQKVASYDLVPQMSAPEITKKLLAKITTELYDFIVVNFANADMVGHSGNLEATIKAVKTIDESLGQIKKSTLAQKGLLIVTADHGNAEEMTRANGQISTQHSLNPAPCIFIANGLENGGHQLPEGLLADIAPTILAFLNIPKPPPMTGNNLLTV